MRRSNHHLEEHLVCVCITTIIEKWVRKKKMSLFIFDAYFFKDLDYFAQGLHLFNLIQVYMN